MAPRTLVTGSGRCGTGYLASVLRAAGVDAGHEAWWGLGKQTYVDVDVSWLGCFDHTFTGRVLAQVRDPAAGVPSIYTHERKHPWYLIRRLTCPLTGDWQVDAAIIWHTYTLHALDRSEAWWRVEDLNTDLVALHFDAHTEPESFTTAPRNSRGDTSGYTWPDHPITERCSALAVELGYTPVA